MTGLIRSIAASLALLATASLSAAPAHEKRIASVDLSKPFHTRTAWRFTATQGPDVVSDDPVGDGEPGTIHLCIGNGGDQACHPDLQHALRGDEGEDFFSDPHYLEDTRVVYPRGPAAPPLLLVETRSVHAGNGSQRAALQAAAYDPGKDRFMRAYLYVVGGNMNQEIRYISEGRLRGDIVSVEPTGNAPFGFWVIVNRLSAAYRYVQILRYRSATRYGDNNPLSVIDSEMPNIQGRLGLWHPGQPLPLPAKGCRKPHLVRMELWCS